mmetsp:Transcript_21013/g.52872  ORF Transcript_21013/g.52872 Transcript_21013/m.52872 type:complete len:214 (-) Transcript_21013:34-675(-)
MLPPSSRRSSEMVVTVHSRRAATQSHDTPSQSHWQPLAALQVHTVEAPCQRTSGSGPVNSASRTSRSTVYSKMGSSTTELFFSPRGRPSPSPDNGVGFRPATGLGPKDAGAGGRPPSPGSSSRVSCSSASRDACASSCAEAAPLSTATSPTARNTRVRRRRPWDSSAPLLEGTCIGTRRRCVRRIRRLCLVVVVAGEAESSVPVFPRLSQLPR